MTTVPRTGPLTRTCRRVGLDRNPLRRRVDRMQTALGLLLIVAVLAAVPLAVQAVGAPVYRAEVAAAAAAQARLRPVQATVVSAEHAPLYAPVSSATVRWQAADGTERTAEHRATGLLRPGAPVTVWLDDAGEIVEPPPPARPLGRAVLLTAGVVLLALAAGAGGWLTARALLDRRRLRAWDEEWAGVAGGRGA